MGKPLVFTGGFHDFSRSNVETLRQVENSPGRFYDAFSLYFDRKNRRLHFYSLLYLIFLIPKGKERKE